MTGDEEPAEGAGSRGLAGWVGLILVTVAALTCAARIFRWVLGPADIPHAPVTPVPALSGQPFIDPSGG